jgi:MmyB-like transcription regulator ligand binding domain
VGELSARSDEFRKRWVPTTSATTAAAPRPTTTRSSGADLAYEGLEMAAEPGLTLTIYTAEPGSPSEEALRLLASWAASQEADPDARTLSAERRRA